MVERRTVSALIVDLDGTLVELPVDWDAARRDLADIFEPLGVRSAFRPLERELQRALGELARSGVEATVLAELEARTLESLRKREMQAVDSARPVPGSDRLLAWAAARKVPVIIASSNSCSVAAALFARFGWHAPIAFLGRETRPPKPSAHVPAGILRDLGIDPPDVVLIGDGEFDIALGHALGVRIIRIAQRSREVPTGVELVPDLWAALRRLGVMTASNG